MEDLQYTEHVLKKTRQATEMIVWEGEARKEGLSVNFEREERSATQELFI